MNTFITILVFINVCVSALQKLSENVVSVANVDILTYNNNKN